MAVTKEDMESFNRFADEKLANGGAESFREPVRQWEGICEYEETFADVNESQADIDSG